MSLRTLCERLLQTLAFEAGGLAIATPLYAGLFDRGAAQSAILNVALSVAMLIWMPLYNTLFDLAEWRLASRRASDRPHRWRLAHAVSLEVSSVVVTVPLVMHLGGHGLAEALVVDLGLGALFVAYGYAFHLAFDRLRPVGSARRPQGSA